MNLSDYQSKPKFRLSRGSFVIVEENEEQKSQLKITECKNLREVDQMRVELERLICKLLRSETANEHEVLFDSLESLVDKMKRK